MDLYKVTKAAFIVLQGLAFPVKRICQRRSAPPRLKLDWPDLKTFIRYAQIPYSEPRFSESRVIEQLRSVPPQASRANLKSRHAVVEA